MSGGSYNYLCYKDPEQLLAYDVEDEIEKMAQRLAGLGYAEDAARETEELLLIIRQTRIRLRTRTERLRDVWRAVEWWDSCDSGPDYLAEELGKYRAAAGV